MEMCSVLCYSQMFDIVRDIYIITYIYYLRGGAWSKLGGQRKFLVV